MPLQLYLTAKAALAPVGGRSHAVAHHVVITLLVSQILQRIPRGFTVPSVLPGAAGVLALL